MSGPRRPRLPAVQRILGELLLRPLLSADDRAEALRAVGELYTLRRRLGRRHTAEIYALRQILLFVPRLTLDRLRPNPADRAPLPPRSRTRPMESLLHSTRYLLRSLLRAPGYAGVIIVTLAICIGANTAIYTVIRSVLLDPLPYAEPDRVVGVWMTRLPDQPRLRMTPGNYTDLREQTELFDALAAFAGITTTLRLDDGDVIRLDGGRVTGEYLRVLGIRPLLGRDFVPEELEQGGPPVTMLSYELWTSRFRADESVVGKIANYGGNEFEIVGVLPPGLYPMSQSIAGDIPLGQHDQQFLVPLRYSPALYTNRRPHIIGVVGRLGAGVTVEQAAETVAALGQRLAQEDPQNAGEGLVLTPFRDAVVRDSRLALLVLMASVGVVLLIAATNVAGLMLVRSDSRRAELAVRAALGAPRGRLLRLLLAESLLLSTLGAAGGVLLAIRSLEMLRRTLPIQIPRLEGATIDLDVLGFTLAATLVTALLAGFAPALRATSPRMLGALKQGATRVSGSRETHRMHANLLALQIALAVVLVVGAGLLARTFWSLRAVDLGFRPSHVVTLSLSVPSGRGGSFAEAWAFQREVRDALAAVPGVITAGLAYDHPLERTWEDGFEIVGQAAEEEEDRGGASLRPISGGYLETAGIELLAGRALDDRDDHNAPGAVLVNEALARQYFAGRDPIGESLRIPSTTRFWGDQVPAMWEIVGVVANVRFMGPDAEPQPAIYPSMLQFPVTDLTAMVRIERSARGVEPALAAALRDIDSTLPRVVPRGLDDFLGDALARERFGMLLVGAFAAVGLLLASMGTWGLVSRAASAREREIGIRVALGAPGSTLTARLLRGALAPAVAGVAVGLIAAALLSRLLQGLLFGVSALDLWTYLAAPLLLLAITLGAGGLPAIRGARCDPIRALRGE